MKKITVLILLSVMVFSLSVFAEDSLSGEALKELGLIQGDGSGLNESGDITREALVKMVVSLTTDLTDDFVVPETPTFSDVPNDHWAYSWVERAYARELTKGIGNGLFGLGQKVTQQQVSAFMLNALNATYDYKNAVESASNKGISTHVVENFNRGNAFEMVSKTLLLTPVGQEKALFETNKNFQGKNFKQIVADLELKRDEAKKAAEAIAAAEAKKAEEEKLAQQATTMAKYRSSWPNNLETYLEWLTDAEKILEPTWEKITYNSYVMVNNSNFIFNSVDELSNSVDININRGYTMSLEFGGASYLEESEMTVSNIDIFYSEEYEAYRVEGEYEGQPIKFWHMKDSNSPVKKGLLNLGSDQYVIRLSSSHPIVDKVYQVQFALYEPSFKDSFKNVSLTSIEPWLVDDLKLHMVISVQSPVTKSYRTVGLDEYTFLFSQITTKKLTVKKSFDDETELLNISTFKRNVNGDVIKINAHTRDYKTVIITIKLDEDQAIEEVFVQYNDYFGTYIKE